MPTITFFAGLASSPAVGAWIEVEPSAFAASLDPSRSPTLYDASAFLLAVATKGAHLDPTADLIVSDVEGFAAAVAPYTESFCGIGQALLFALALEGEPEGADAALAAWFTYSPGFYQPAHLEDARKVVEECADVHLSVGTLKERAEEQIGDMIGDGTIPEHLAAYIDVDAYARDLGYDVIELQSPLDDSTHVFDRP